MRNITSVVFVALCLISSSAFAAPTYLECQISTTTTNVSVTLNEATGKVTHTYIANGSGFTSDGQFNANTIIYQKKIPNLGQTERFTIDRGTLAIKHEIFMRGDAVTDGSGQCEIVKPDKNKI